MVDILDKLNQWTNQPGSLVYLLVGLGIVVIASVYLYTVIDKRLAPFRNANLRYAVVSGNLVVYTGTQKGRSYGNNENMDNTKIETLNVEDGSIIKTRILYDDEYTVQLIAEGMIWTKIMQEMRSSIHAARSFKANVLDLHTLETRYDDKAIELHFNFKEGEKLADIRLDETDSKIVFASNTGSNYHFDTSKAPFNNPVQTTPSPSSSFNSGIWHNPYTVKIKPDSRRYFIYLEKKCIGTESFIEPVWVNELHHENLEGIVIVHPQTIDPYPNVSLTFLAMDGKIIWTITQQSMGIEAPTNRDRPARFAYCGAYKNLVVYRVDAPRGSDKIIALIVTDGKIVWAKNF